MGGVFVTPFIVEICDAFQLSLNLVNSVCFNSRIAIEPGLAELICLGVLSVFGLELNVYVLMW